MAAPAPIGKASGLAGDEARVRAKRDRGGIRIGPRAAARGEVHGRGGRAARRPMPSAAARSRREVASSDVQPRPWPLRSGYVVVRRQGRARGVLPGRMADRLPAGGGGAGDRVSALAETERGGVVSVGVDRSRRSRERCTLIITGRWYKL
jgi:hypothetical protein